MGTTIENQEVEISLEEMCKLFPKRIELSYVDYNDNLNENIEDVLKMIQTQDYSVLEDQIFDWWMESSDNSVDEYIKELKSDLEHEYDFDTDDELDDIIEDKRDELRWYLEEHDESNVLKDLLRNTSDIVAFFDTCLELYESDYSHYRKDTINLRNQIKRKLKIDLKNHQYDKQLDIMILQSSGGRLVVYFTIDTDTILSYWMKLDENGYNAITFKNAMIAIIDTYNGSGDNTHIQFHEFTLPFDKNNLFFDKAIKYNYTYKVCNMYSDWCDCTQYSPSKVEKPKKAKQSSLNAD